MQWTGKIPAWLRRTGIEVAGWTLIVAGLAALVLPGPGLLMLVAGLAVLGLRYHWARRFLHPVKAKAFQAAATGVKTWTRVAGSVLGALCIMGIGVIWILQPPVPGWWPLEQQWWLPGGAAAGASFIVSGLIALSLIAYSVRRFRRPKAAASRSAQAAPAAPAARNTAGNNAGS